MGQGSTGSTPLMSLSTARLRHCRSAGTGPSLLAPAAGILYGAGSFAPSQPFCASSAPSSAVPAQGCPWDQMEQGRDLHPQLTGTLVRSGSSDGCRARRGELVGFQDCDPLLSLCGCAESTALSVVVDPPCAGC